MKTSIVPAEITTLEDSITAKLSLTQVIILVCPIILSTLIFSLVPPFFKLSLIKILIVLIVGLPILVLAIKFKSRLIFFWLILLAKYYLNPQYYFLSVSSSNYCQAKEEEAKNTNLDHKAQLKDLQTKDLPITIEYDDLTNQSIGAINVFFKN